MDSSVSFKYMLSTEALKSKYIGRLGQELKQKHKGKKV